MESLVLRLFLASLLVLQIGYVQSRRQGRKHVALFIFGDSLFDPGNNNYIDTNTSFQANFRPYGESFFKYPTGRFSDGRLIPDFIAEYLKLPCIPPFRQPGCHQFAYGANFASGGAGALVETYPGLVINLKVQLQDFQKVESYLKRDLGAEEAELILSNGVYLFSVGGNDYFSFPTSTNPIISQKDYVKMVLGNVTDVIQKIYMKGGRKFGFVKMPPLGCLPTKRTPGGECDENLTKIAALHNEALPKVLEKLENRFEGFKYSLFDLYATLQERIDNPSKYGFEEGKSGCCGSGRYRGIYSCGGKRGVEEYQLCANASSYVFFDSAHPSQSTYKQLAKLMWNGTPDFVWPYNLKHLAEL